MEFDMKIAATAFWVALFLMVITGLMEAWGIFILATFIWIMSAVYLIKNVK